MENKISNRQKNNRIILMILLLLSGAATVTKIAVGFDIDEAYAVTMPYRLLQGDRLFKDMWEVHQTSSFLPYLFIALFVKLTKGTEGLVLFLRCAATGIHLFFSVLVYKTLRKEFESTTAGTAALLYYNFLPKWMMNFDFSMQQLWFMTASLLLLYEGTRRARKLWYFASGILLAAAVLAYPGMVLLYPAYLWVIRTAQREDHQEAPDRGNIEKMTQTGGMQKKNIFEKRIMGNCLSMTAGCAVMAVLFFAYVLSAVSVTELIKSIPMVFSDGSHSFSPGVKLGLYAGQWLEVLIQAGILLIPSAILAGIYGWLQNSMQGNRAERKAGCKADFFADFCMMVLFVSSGIVVIAELIGIKWGPFRLQVRYLILFVLAFVCAGRLRRSDDRKKTKKAQGILMFLLFPSVFMFAGILIASNVGPVSSASYLVLADMAFVLLYFEYTLTGQPAELKTEQDGKETPQKEDPGRSVQKVLQYSAVFLFLLSLIFCKGYYVRMTEYVPSGLSEPRLMLKNGAAKGIWVLEKDFERMEDNCDTIRKTVQSDEKYLFMGTEALNNLCATQKGACFVSPTTISTPAFNEQWTTYFERYPDKQPDVIFIAKNTVDNREKFFAQNPFGQWIASNYDIGHMQETEYLCILRKKS
jgi:hypothetical protein